MRRADVVKHARDRTPHPIIITFGRIGMDRTASVFALGMIDGIVGTECGADKDEALPCIAHQVRILVYRITEDPVRFCF